MHNHDCWRGYIFNPLNRLDQFQRDMDFEDVPVIVMPAISLMFMADEISGSIVGLNSSDGLGNELRRRAREFLMSFVLLNEA
jgi:hypothetical protein